jgi:uncharacterized protein YndB with AHSA1/START domain
MAKWSPPYGYTGRVHEMSPVEGGSYRMSFTCWSTGETHAFGGTFVELEPNRRIVYTDQFDDAALAGEIRTSIHIDQVVVGSEITLVQEGLPVEIPVEAAVLGWQESLEQLARLVEPNLANASVADPD